MQQKARAQKIDEKPCLTRRNWWPEERDRAVRNSVKTGLFSIDSGKHSGRWWLRLFGKGRGRGGGSNETGLEAGR
ncbi:unnamed protein product [Prunus armeniaca]